MYQMLNIILDPKRVETWHNLGRLPYANRKTWLEKNFDQLIKSLQAYKLNAPELTSAQNPWNLLGFTCLNDNLYEKAEKIYDRLFNKIKDIHGPPSIACYFRGITKFLQGRYNDAYEDFKLSRHYDLQDKNFSAPALKAISYMEETIFPTKETILRNQSKLHKDLSAPRLLEKIMGPYTLRTLHKWNSSSPLFSRNISQGGGYFLTLKNPQGETKGIVIDPGYDFYNIFRDIGLGIADIDAIIITHDHDDHTESVEGILSLLAKYNDHNPQRKSRVLDIFGSAGVMLKFHGILGATDLSGSREINFKLMVPGNTIEEIEGKSLKEKYGFVLHTIPAFHTERWTNQESSLGVVLDTILPLEKQGEKLKIGISGDSRYENGLGRSYKDVQLLLLNIGSIEKEEGKLLSQHLGICGCINLLKEARLGKPLLAILTEFGEELAGKRETISKIIETWAYPLGASDQKQLRVIPSDIHLEVRLSDLNIRENDTKAFFPYQMIEVDESDEQILKYRFKN